MLLLLLMNQDYLKVSNRLCVYILTITRSSEKRAKPVELPSHVMVGSSGRVDVVGQQVKHQRVYVSVVEFLHVGNYLKVN